MANQSWPELTSVWHDVGPYRIHTRQAGFPESHRVPIVLVHGLGMSSRYMAPLARRLARHGAVYAPDLPGFGRSATPTHTLNVGELAEVLIAWMDAQGLGQVSLIGNSLGCQVIVETAFRFPERASRLVLVAPTMDRHARTAATNIYRLVVDAWCEPWSLLFLAAWAYWDTGFVRLWRTLQHGLEHRVEELLPGLALPTLVVRGAMDPIVPQPWVEEVTQLLPHGRLIVIPKGTHAVHYAMPDLVLTSIEPFLLAKMGPVEPAPTGD
jgi:pimeloyl-ACP methyl ester carboxylesterase